ncbi:ribosome recycling factor [Flavobacteriaceae bacterium]|nr:ribosome recycling factor [Flavobacteriaceae bacterium]
MNDILESSENKMQLAITAFVKDLSTISTGRANSSLLDRVLVDSYGSMMPISQVANISVLDASRLSIQVWDKALVKEVEKAIINSNLGFNPIPEGQKLIINIPKLSSERRVELVKLAKKYGEDKKISIRNARRDGIDSFKKAEPSEDQKHSFNSAIQKITDTYISKIDNMLKEKEKDITTI